MLPLSKPRLFSGTRTGMRVHRRQAGRRSRVHGAARVAAALVLMPLLTVGVAAQELTDLANVSLDSLLAIPVHSAARYAQTMTEAPAAVTVVTSEEIAAFGYRTLDQ